MTDFSYLNELLDHTITWIDSYILTFANMWQLVCSACIILFAMLIKERTYKAFVATFESSPTIHNKLLSLDNAHNHIAWPVIALLSHWLIIAICRSLEVPSHVLASISKLLLAWIIIRSSSYVIKQRQWARLFATFAWTIAALSILNILEPVLTTLDGLALKVGNLNISILSLIWGLATLVLMLWLAQFISRKLETHIHSLQHITPSVRVLIVKIIKIIFIALALLISLNALGIDLTALAVFGGAVGLGIGFGLQKVISNLFSGFILLLDRSVKPGDVIEIDNTFGWVNSLGARHVSILTRDGVEYLVPNEHLITEKVTNWSYTDTNMRLKIPLSVSYDSGDVRHIMKIITDCALSEDRVLKDPEPVCRLVDFGDYGIKLELRIWINTPKSGMVNIRSDILLRIWDAFKANNIEIPYPRQDIHLTKDSD